MNSEETTVEKSPSPPPNKRAKWILVAIAAVGVGAAVIVLPVRSWLGAFLEWTSGLGMWGAVIIALVYIPACVLLLPGSVLTLGAGFLFGVIEGTIAVSLGSTAGACAAFMVGRTLARDWVEKKMASNARFGAIAEAVRLEGFKIVLLTRLSPVFPFNLLNYAFGLTSVSFSSYALASWLGMVPGTLLYVYLGSGARSLAQVAAGEVEGGPPQRIFFWFGLVVTLIVAVLITRMARRALKQAVPKAETEGG